jgi:hypothetical protein
LINHITRFQTSPNSEYEKRIWGWFQTRNVKVPVTVLRCTYLKKTSSDYVTAVVSVNPEKFGQSSATKTVWAESEWHPNAVKGDPTRAAFVDRFKKWCYVMAENARATLYDRKPMSMALPSFEELRLN